MSYIICTSAKDYKKNGNYMREEVQKNEVNPLVKGRKGNIKIFVIVLILALIVLFFALKSFG